MTELKFQIQLTKSTTFLYIILEIQRVFLYKRSRLVEKKTLLKQRLFSIFYYKKKRLEHNRHYYQHI